MGKIDDDSRYVSRKSNQRRLLDGIYFSALILVVIVSGAVLWIESMSCPGVAQYNNFLAIAHWFDPIFFQYNLIMVSLAILILPLLVLSYTTSKIGSKERRLLQELRDSCTDEMEFEEQEKNVTRRIGSRASFSAYSGSLLLSMLVVSLGACILLLFKPAYSPDQLGVHFDLGANMLMMGPFIELFEPDNAQNMAVYYGHLTRSLTAFQFGFLGAYIYFVGSLARAYFTLDLTPHTFVDGSIRMIVASVLALVISFAPIIATPAAPTATPAVAAETEQPASAVAQNDTPKAAENNIRPVESLGWLPIVSFFFGFYPKQALAQIRRITARFFELENSQRELPLSSLAGISYPHETRLEREGFDNVENLSHADAIDLAIRTGFGYKQLAQWIDEAWLATHLREDYAEFVKRTGITCREELKLFFAGCNDIAQAAAQLKMTNELTRSEQGSAPGVPWEGKLAGLNVLIEPGKPAVQNG